ncbi:MAG TPA: hypothetical protein VIL46_15945, partial [Gemmataceae bacterium]
VAIIRRRFREGALWCAAAAILAGIGLIHSYEYTKVDTSLALLRPARDWALAYAAVAVLLWLAPHITEPAAPGEPPERGGPP